MATITFPSGKLKFEFDDSQTGVKHLINKVKALGYGTDEEENSGILEGVLSTNICIIGMDCADCAAKLEKRISKVPGVEEVKIITCEGIILSNKFVCRGLLNNLWKKYVAQPIFLCTL